MHAYAGEAPLKEETRLQKAQKTAQVLTESIYFTPTLLIFLCQYV